MTDLLVSRRNELLQIARRSRIKWVVEEKEALVEDSGDTKTNDPLKVSESLQAKIPAAKCIQNVLNFLTDVVADGEQCDVASIAAGIIDYDDYNDDQYSRLTNRDSTKPDTYNDFIGKLILPASTELVKSMQQFITKFLADFQASKVNPLPVEPQPEPTDEELQSWPSRVWTFLDHVYENMKELAIWSEESVQQFEVTKTHCEKFVFSKLYPVLFSSDVEDILQNERTKERIESLGFLTAEHLDIKCVKALYEQYVKKQNTKPKEHLQSQDYDFLNDILEQPIKFLLELNIAKCPQDKLTAVKRCTMSIAQLLKGCRSDGTLPGADELLPMMIYAIKCCNPPCLHSNLKYLQRYTRPSHLIGEAGYLLTNFVSAVFFLDNVDAKALTIEPEEFDRAILQSKMKAKAANDKVILQQQKNMAKYVAKNGMANANNTRSGATGEAEEDFNVETLLRDHKKALNANNKVDVVSVMDIHRRRAGIRQISY